MQRDVSLKGLVYDFGIAEIGVAFHFAFRQTHRRDFDRATLYRKTDFVAVQIITVGNVPGDFNTVGAKRFGRNLEGLVGWQKIVSVKTKK